MEEAQNQISSILDGMKELLLEKNKRYGNAALSPRKVFSKLDSANSIMIRLDDKLNRIENSQELRVNDVADVLGYCTLLLVSKGVTKQDIINLID